jgi:hypothetical protein
MERKIIDLARLYRVEGAINAMQTPTNTTSTYFN